MNIAIAAWKVLKGRFPEAKLLQHYNINRNVVRSDAPIFVFLRHVSFARWFCPNFANIKIALFFLSKNRGGVLKEGMEGVSNKKNVTNLNIRKKIAHFSITIEPCIYSNKKKTTWCYLVFRYERFSFETDL